MPGDLTSSIFIDADPAEVFPYFIDPALIVSWMADRAEIDPTPGGRFSLEVAGTRVQGRYVDVRPPHRVVLTWGFADSDDLPPGASTVEVDLVAEGRGTRVIVVHRDLSAHQQHPHERGWQRYLGQLSQRASARHRTGD